MTRYLLTAVVLAWSVPSHAAVVWTATFEKGDLSEWKPGVNELKGQRVNAEASGERFYRGAKAGKITVHPDDTFTFNQNRVDIQHPSSLTDEGEEMWLSGHYLLVEDAKVRNEIGFFESNVSYQNVMDFWVEPKSGGGTTINFGIGFLGENKLWTADFATGVWHQLAIHVLWSTDPTKGLVDVWYDGQKVVAAHKAKTKADANSLFFQTGLHRKDVAPFTETLFFDEFIEADSEADAKIAAPSTNPAMGGGGGFGAGGASGAAGVGGTSGAGPGGMAGSVTAAGSGMGGSLGSAGNLATGSGGGGTSVGGSAAPSAGVQEDSSCSILTPGRASGRGAGSALLVSLVLLVRRRVLVSAL